jgi:hypothetical protein
MLTNCPPSGRNAQVIWMLSPSCDASLEVTLFNVSTLFCLYLSSVDEGTACEDIMVVITLAILVTCSNC